MAAYLMSEGLARFVSDLRRGSQRGYRGGVDASRQMRLAAAQADDFPLPFTVVWSESVGEWIVWVPDAALVLGSSAVDIRTGLTAAGGGYPSGWYKAGISASATSIYLVSSTSGGSVSWSFSASAAGTGETSVLVATMTVDKAVRQSITSAIVLGDSHMGNKTGSVATVGGVTFASASDACVEVLTASGGTVTIGVYYV